VGLGTLSLFALLGSISIWNMWRADYLLSQGKQLVRAGSLVKGTQKNDASC
jgi:hypothetical protein